MWGKGNTYLLLMEMQTGAVTLEMYGCSIKTKNTSTV